MIEYIHHNMAGFWIALGFILLTLEVLLFGFSTIVFLFAGIGAIITGILLTLGLIPDTWIVSIASFGILTGLSSLLLWKPLKRMQNESTSTKQSNDFEGVEFNLESDINASLPGKIRYSGVDWQVVTNATETIAKGTRVVVTTADVGVFHVKEV